jgi:hypothetical protein
MNAHKYNLWNILKHTRKKLNNQNIMIFMMI